MFSFITRAMAAGVALFTGASALAAYPDKPIRLLVPYVAGSPADNAARRIAEGLALRVGQSVIVENKAGANGMIGSEQVARAAPDGYTIMLGNMDTHALNPLLYRTMRYDPVKDFEPVALLGTLSTMLVARAGAPFNDGPALIATARREPGKLTYGSWGLGSVAHLWGGLAEDAAGIQFLHVPFQGTPAALNALMGGQIDLLFAPPSLAVANARTGKLKIIGSTAASRLANYPDVPTLAEQGFANYEGTTWFGIFAPARTPADRLDRLNAEINAVLTSPSMAETAATLTMNVRAGDRQQLSAVMQESRSKWGRIIQSKNISLTE